MGKERARCATACGAKISAVFDTDQARSAELVAHHRGESLRSVDDFFEKSLDALFVCLAPGSRGSVELDSIAAGLPFFVEKPIGVSLERCQPILSHLQDRPLVNGVGYMNRYRSSVLQTKRILSEADVIGFSAHWVCKRYQVPWWESEPHSGGPHNEQATHLFDLCRFLVGEVEGVQSRFRGVSQVSSSLECTGGVLGNVFYSCDGNGKDIGFQVFTRRGSVVLSGWDFHLAGNTVDGRVADHHAEDIFLIETGVFLQAVESRRPELVKSDFVDAARTQAVMDAVRRSGVSHQPVHVRPCGIGLSA